MNTQEQLGLLLSLGNEISKQKDLDAILQTIGNTARDILDADRCSIFIYDHIKEELWTKVAHGVEEIRIPVTKGIAGIAARSKEIQIVLDAYQDFRFNSDIDKKTGYITQNILAVPLIDLHDEVVGVFQALNKKNGSFGIVDAEMLQLIGNYTSAALENAILYEKLKNSHAKVISKIATAAEFKDNETHLHTKRVGLYSQLLAQAYGLGQKECELILLTAPMHDTGKIGIPDKVLLKPGKLDEEEFKIMKTHVTIGYEILFDDENTMLQMAAIIAKEHHEKYNGKGYPFGLKGDEISIYAKIVAIADVFDALMSKRPYKEPWPLEKALELIKSEKSQHFDPHIVDLFFENINEIKVIMEKYQEH